jgi:hypothetical protein
MINCQNCGAENSVELKNCALCDFHLSAGSRSSNLPPGGVWHFCIGGFGVCLFNQKQHDNNLFSATRWITFLFIPILPLSTVLFRPLKSSSFDQAEFLKIQIFKRSFPKLRCLLRTYLLFLISILPFFLAIKFGDQIRDFAGVLLGTLTFIGAAVWWIYIVNKMQNDKIDYESLEK